MKPAALNCRGKLWYLTTDDINRRQLTTDEVFAYFTGVFQPYMMCQQQFFTYIRDDKMDGFDEFRFGW